MKRGIADPISFNLGQPKDVEVCDALSGVHQHPGVLMNGADFLKHKEHYDHIAHSENFQPWISSACTQFMYKKSARGCNFRAEICLGQHHAHSLMYGSIFQTYKRGHQALDHELICFSRSDFLWHASCGDLIEREQGRKEKLFAGLSWSRLL
jgi:hypothetical protein